MKLAAQTLGLRETGHTSRRDCVAWRAPLRALLCLGLLAMLVGCVGAPPPPPMSPLELRSMQSREYSTRDTRMVMKALLNVLQDEGFITKNAVMDLGLITATKESDLEDSSDMLLHSLLGGRDARWQKNSVIEANANVSEFGSSTRVRVTFQKKIFDNVGAVMRVLTIDNATYYQDFFSKVDKGIFYQRERL